MRARILATIPQVRGGRKLPTDEEMNQDPSGKTIRWRRIDQAGSRARPVKSLQRCAPRHSFRAAPGCRFDRVDREGRGGRQLQHHESARRSSESAAPTSESGEHCAELAVPGHRSCAPLVKRMFTRHSRAWLGTLSLRHGARMLRPALALLVQLCALVAWAGPALAEPVQFVSASVPPTPFMQRQAELRGTVAQPTPGNQLLPSCGGRERAAPGAGRCARRSGARFSCLVVLQVMPEHVAGTGSGAPPSCGRAAISRHSERVVVLPGAHHAFDIEAIRNGDRRRHSGQVPGGAAQAVAS